MSTVLRDRTVVQRGREAATGVLLSWFEFVAFEIEGFEERRELKREEKGPP